MEILELQMKNFGKFSGETRSFSSGINVIYGANEMGKTTMHSFIKGMFFGIDKLRGRAAKNDEYSLREPWENSNFYQGVLRFKSGEKIFRLERSFQKKERWARLICETDGEELSIENGDLEVLLEGMNESAFRNTVFIQQKGSATDAAMAAELQNFMTNIQNSGNSDINVTKAVSLLNQKKKQLEGQKKASLTKMEEEQKNIKIQLDYVDSEIYKLDRERSELEMTLEEQKHHLKGEQGNHEKIWDKAETKASVLSPKAQGMSLWLKILLAVTGVLAIAATLYFDQVWQKLLGWLILITAAGVYGMAQRNRRGKTDGSVRENPEESPRIHPSREQLLVGEIRKIQWTIERNLRDRMEQEVVRGNLEESLEEIQSQDSQTRKLDEDIQAIILAISTIDEIAKEIYDGMAKELNTRISQILSEITQGAYTSVFLNPDMEVRINTPEKLLTLEQVSRGTMDQIYFALRMAVGEFFAQGEAMPVVLDDAFAMYDDNRLRAVLKWLKDSKKQVLLFTCHRREQEILNSL